MLKLNKHDKYRRECEKKMVTKRKTKTKDGEAGIIMAAAGNTAPTWASDMFIHDNFFISLEIPQNGLELLIVTSLHLLANIYKLDYRHLENNARYSGLANGK